MNIANKLQLMYDIATRFSEEATCPRMKSGAVIFTPDFHIVSGGYNGAPHGLPQCNQIGCLVLGGHCARSAHAEVNAITQVARVGGFSVNGLYIAMTNFPCPFCTRTIIQAGIIRIYYGELAPTYSEEHRKIVQESCNFLKIKLKKWG